MPRLSLQELLALSWTWKGPVEVTDDGSSHHELRIAELPDYFVAGETWEDVVREATPALRAYLESYLARGEDPPMPAERRWIFFHPTLPQRPSGTATSFSPVVRPIMA